MADGHDANTRRLLNARSKWIRHVEWFKQIRDCGGLVTRDVRRLRHILNLASGEKLKSLASLTHHFLIGDVQVPSEIARKIIRSRKLNFLRRSLENERDLRTAVTGGRNSLLPIFYRTQSVIPLIVSLFFAPANATTEAPREE